MDNKQINKKIQTLKLELARKQRKLLKWNELCHLKKAKENSGSPLQLNGISCSPERPCSPNILNSKPVLNLGVKESFGTTPDHSAVEHKRGIDSADSGEEELFPDDVQEPSDTKDIFQENSESKETVNIDSRQRTVKDIVNRNCHVAKEPSKNTSLQATSNPDKKQTLLVSPLSDSPVDCHSQKHEDSSSRRRSLRISSKVTTDTSSLLKNKKLKLDLQSVVSVTFEILCQMGKNLSQEDFSLPDGEFNLGALQSDSKTLGADEVTMLQSKVHETVQNKRTKETESEDTGPTELCFSENMVPPTFAVESMNLVNSRRQSFFKKKVPCKVNSVSSALNTNHGSTDENCNESVSSLIDGIFEDRSKFDNESFAPSNNVTVVAAEDVKRVINKDKNEKFQCGSQEIKDVCERVVTEMMSMLDTSSTEDTEILKKRNISFENDESGLVNVQSIRATHCLSGSTEDVEDLFLSNLNEVLLAFVQRRRSVSVWEEHKDGWLEVYIYKVEKGEEILGLTLLNSRFAVLVKGNHFKIRVLVVNEGSFELQSEISLGTQSRGAISGLLGTLEQDYAVSSCLTFEKGFSQVEIHIAKPGQSTQTVYFEPPSENIFGPVVSVSGLPNALMGLGVNKLYFWNVSTGLLAQSVLLVHEKENSKFEKCIWAKLEKGLLFGVFKEVSSENWILLVINPATGLLNKLCQYSCPTCKESANESKPRPRYLQGKVECHKLLSICSNGHLTVFHLLSGNALVVSKDEDTSAASLNANVLIMSDSDGSVNTFRISSKK